MRGHESDSRGWNTVICEGAFECRQKEISKAASRDDYRGPGRLSAPNTASSTSTPLIVPFFFLFSIVLAVIFFFFPSRQTDRSAQEI
jgi:hypothetical protein